MDNPDYYDTYETYNTSDYNSTSLEYLETEHQVILPLLVLIGVAGLLGNGALVIIILFKTNPRKVPNAFILSLAIADLIVILFYVPSVAFVSFPFGDLVCKASEFLNEVAAGVSAFSLIALTVYCFFEPTPQRDWTTRSTGVVVAGVWTLATIFAGPTLFFAQVIHEHDSNTTTVAVCHPFDPWIEQRQGPLRFAVYYAIPVMAFAFFYALAILEGTINKQTRERREISNLTEWLSWVFTGCLLTGHLTTFWILLPNHDQEIWHVLDVTGFYLGLLYRCINPAVLYLVSGHFRKLFNKYLLCWCCAWNREPDAESEMNRPRW